VRDSRAHGARDPSALPHPRTVPAGGPLGDHGIEAVTQPHQGDQFVVQLAVGQGGRVVVGEGVEGLTECLHGRTHVRHPIELVYVVSA
jgi:hypothetical protein